MTHDKVERVDTGRGAHPIDRLLHAGMGRVTGGLSPASLGLAYVDWAIHMGISPGRQTELVEKAWRKATRLSLYAMRCAANGAERHPPCIEPLPQDTRFNASQWQRWPFNVWYQGFLLTQQWWHVATTDIRGVETHHEDVVNFLGRQILDIYSPSNYFWTNPELMETTAKEGGANLYRGLRNWWDDTARRIQGEPPAGMEKWKVGENLALTPGKVVYSNRLIELIQYEPATDRVHPEPVLIVPAWIMKYYILDLRPGKSLVEYLVNQGHTVFMMSWKNPSADDSDLGMEDYRKMGIMDALKAVNTIVPEQKVHAAGYCLGGTLLMLAAAAMAREGDDRLASLTCFAAQCDFTEPGELDLFIDDSQVTFLEDMMWHAGYLSSDQMAGAFQLLRSKDLIWSRMVREYLMGERSEMIDLMAWNADTTRLPYRMHSEYLRQLFLNNDFVEERYDVDGQPIHLWDVRTPIFAVGTTKDHIAPWKSVYKINRLARTDVTFALTTGGHNAGIVTPPGHPRRTYQVHCRKVQDPYLAPDDFLAEVPSKQGSWWPEWHRWLARHSGNKGKPPQMGADVRGYRPQRNAPGKYVLMD
ncbi:PHA/PHB synthase family protein [Alkalilimnicola ehrlichii MLHE-1]|uniref:Poly-beta-hydroxybutyrate polymerase domain protein n=1 Tax=Alkalilimnicola ehrlichii (strain ATCC BAA-1101 / DSM 17681 / MLHE-1) TaxID=187272 RepID=Q0A617_ALKEH|nr:alpha/beta fold hydrolase [Alkalilimnicola ehrlichii]ABI57720.1 Poly-beta-hydroxybutyrate polymerase domain protein [Alkalilimnicola ehrlichii MLHE-1]